MRAETILRAADIGAEQSAPVDTIVLTHDERHLRRRRMTMQQGEHFMVDLPRTVALHHGDRFVLDSGRMVEVIAAEEDLVEITARSPEHHAELCWHLGNRHLPAQVEAKRILIVPDRVIVEMLTGLGAKTTAVREVFTPMRGAYDEHHAAHAHSHNHTHSHSHD